MTTCAQYRELAQQCESALDWSQAAIYWGSAVDAYPITTISKLAANDIAHMQSRARSCRHMALRQSDHETAS